MPSVPSEKPATGRSLDGPGELFLTQDLTPDMATCRPPVIEEARRKGLLLALYAEGALRGESAVFVKVTSE